MKLKLDRDAKAFYLKLNEENVLETEQIKPGLVIDYGKNDLVVGIEMYGLSDESLNSLETSIEPITKRKIG